MSGLDKLRLVSGVLASTDKVVDMPADDTAAASLSHSSQEWTTIRQTLSALFLMLIVFDET